MEGSNGMKQLPPSRCKQKVVLLKFTSVEEGAPRRTSGLWVGSPCLGDRCAWGQLYKGGDSCKPDLTVALGGPVATLWSVWGCCSQKQEQSAGLPPSASGFCPLLPEPHEGQLVRQQWRLQSPPASESGVGAEKQQLIKRPASPSRGAGGSRGVSELLGLKAGDFSVPHNPHALQDWTFHIKIPRWPQRWRREKGS